MCQNLINQWKVTSTWRHHNSCKLVALKLHSSCSYIIVVELHKLHMYMVSYMVSCIPCNSCNLPNSTHAHRNMLSCNELQMVIITQKPNCKAGFKSPHFIILCKLFNFFLTLTIYKIGGLFFYKYFSSIYCLFTMQMFPLKGTFVSCLFH
jgi:hypothetical protein